MFYSGGNNAFPFPLRKSWHEIVPRSRLRREQVEGRFGIPLLLENIPILYSSVISDLGFHSPTSMFVGSGMTLLSFSYS